MKIYFYICLIFLVLILVSIFIYSGNIKQNKMLPAPLAININTDTVAKVEIIYGYEKGSLKRKKIELSDFNKVLNIIKSYIIQDAHPQKSCPWIDFILYKTNGKKIYINLLLRNSDVMVQVEKKSWLVPHKNKGKLKKCLEEILSSSK